MLVFWKQKLVLFAVPKTGTTALEAALAPKADIAILNPPGLKHCNVQKYARDFAKPFERNDRPLARMAVVRAPMTWLASWYVYRARPQIAGQANAVPPGMDFAGFVQEWLRDDPAPFARIGTQARFVTDRDDRIAIDHLFRYEALAQALRFLEARLETQITLAPHNTAPFPHPAIDPALEAQVRQARPREFAVWDMAEG